MRSVEDQARWLLRAWPVVDRFERADEIVATTLDLVPTGRTRLPLALGANLILGGLRARNRIRPRVWQWFCYACFGVVPPHRGVWLEGDVLRPGFCRRFRTRRFIAVSVLLAAVSLVLGLVLEQMLPDRTVGLLIAAVGGLLGGHVRSREEVLARARAQLAREGRGDTNVRVGRQFVDEEPRRWARRGRTSNSMSKRLREATDVCSELRAIGREKEATDLLADVFVRGERHAPGAAVTLSAGHQLANALLREGRADEAVAVGRTVVAAKRRLHGACHRSTLESASILGAALLASGRLEEAIEVLADTFQRCKRHHLDDSSATLLSGQALAAALTQAGRVQEAVEVRVQMIAGRRRRRVSKRTHPKGNLPPVRRLQLALEQAVRQGCPRDHLRHAAGVSVVAVLGALFLLDEARNGNWILVALNSLWFLGALTWAGFSATAWRRALALRRHSDECLAAQPPLQPSGPKASRFEAAAAAGADGSACWINQSTKQSGSTGAWVQQW